MRLLPLLVVLILSACIPAKPGTGGKPAVSVENPITGGAITVTPLAAVPPDAAAVPRPKPNPAAAPPDPATKPAAAESAADIAPAPARMVSAAEQTCIRQGGSWGPAGKAGETCTKLTKDSGKQCNAESDCEGYCLARSGTCAPFIPMFGCNEILQDNGVQVTLCID